MEDEVFDTEVGRDFRGWCVALDMDSFRNQAHTSGAINSREQSTLMDIRGSGREVHNAKLLGMVAGAKTVERYQRLADTVKALGHPKRCTQLMDLLSALGLPAEQSQAAEARRQDPIPPVQPASPNMDPPPAAAEFGAHKPAVSDFRLKFWTSKEPVTSEDEYDMSRKPRGIALIICNKKFTTMEERKGADKDRDALDKLWTDLHFKTERLDDADAADMRTKLQNLATDPCHKEYNCVVVCIMSHGSENTVYGSDEEEEPISKLVELFHNDKVHKFLRDKPKMFFIQACRGEKDDTGAQADDSRTACPTDMLVCHATAPGYRAWRDPDLGSWFIQCLVDVFRKNHKKEHVADMMITVNREIHKKFDGKHTQAPHPLVLLRKKVHLK